MCPVSPRALGLNVPVPPSVATAPDPTSAGWGWIPRVALILLYICSPLFIQQLTLPVMLGSEAAAALPIQRCSQGRQLGTGHLIGLVWAAGTVQREERTWGEGLGEYS